LIGISGVWPGEGSSTGDGYD